MIDTEPKLAGFLEHLRAATWVAVDTEADSLHAYPEKVCLIQVSTVAGDELVDPLSNLDLTPFLETLGGRELLMHGADYDLRLLEKHHRFIPASIFDTMLAARLIGEPHFGYSALVEKFLGVKLEKGPQKANWAIRPLTERMAHYARNDTHYLKPLVERLKTTLAEKGRLAWQQESCARLIADCTQPRPDDSDSAWRIKGSHLLGCPALAVLRELWRWRESEAIAANRPPFFVMNHETVVNLAATAAAQTPVEPLFPRHLSERRRSGVVVAIARGLAVPPENHPHFPPRLSQRPTAAEHKRSLELQTVRDRHAQELGIDPTLIVTPAAAWRGIVWQT